MNDPLPQVGMEGAMKHNSKDIGRKETFHSIDRPCQKRVDGVECEVLQAYIFILLVHFYSIYKVWILATFISCLIRGNV